MKIGFVVPLVLLSAQPVLAAPAWDAQERVCVAAMEQKCTEIHGANCLGWWPSTARCTLAGLAWASPPTPERIDQCINFVSQKRASLHLCAMCGTDPIADVVRCVIGE